MIRWLCCRLRCVLGWVLDVKTSELPGETLWSDLQKSPFDINKTSRIGPLSS